jgi:hypothetical protein
MVRATEVTNVGSVVSWLTLDHVTSVGLLLLIIFLLVRGKLITRKTADEEKQALIAGYTAKDEAHKEVLDFKNSRIEELDGEKQLLRGIVQRREEQLGLVLDEVAPSLIAWAESVKEATKGVVRSDSSNLAS